MHLQEGGDFKDLDIQTSPWTIKRKNNSVHYNYDDQGPGVQLLILVTNLNPI